MSETYVNVISYNDFTSDLGDNKISLERAREVVSKFYPEVKNASAEISTLPDGRTKVNFVKRAGDNG